MSTVIRLELLQLVRSAWFRGALIVFAAFAGLALWIGATERDAWAQAASATREAAERALAHEQENIVLNRQEGFYPPGTPSAQIMDATLPPAEASVLAIGDAPDRPITASVGAMSRADTMFKNNEVTSA